MDVIIITGMGGMGTAIARRIGAGQHLMLTDINKSHLETVAEQLRREGFSVDTQVLDVADPAAVAAFAQAAAAKGFVRALVHTAGVSPLMADAARVYAVDLTGTANVIDAFDAHVGDGSVCVLIASMAGQVIPAEPELERQLAEAPSAELINIIGDRFADNSEMAYALAKRGNQLRAEQTAVAWGPRGARIVSISPGLTATALGELELQKPHIREFLDNTPLRRIGTTQDIAAAVEWLISPAASYITGCDLLIDGGSIAAQRAAGRIAR